MQKHDDHYSKMKIESIEVMEQRIEPHPEITNQQLQCMAIALKHIIRAGHKEGQPWKKDIEKAINYLTRALTGEWAGTEVEKPPIIGVCTSHTQLGPDYKLCKCGYSNSQGNIICAGCGSPFDLVDE